MKLFFDTETTGVPKNYRAPMTDLENWPRLVQLGYVIYDLQDGGEWQEYAAIEHIIIPEGFVISEEVSKIHGISHQQAVEHGVHLRPVLQQFLDWAEICNLKALAFCKYTVHPFFILLIVKCLPID